MQIREEDFIRLRDYMQTEYGINLSNKKALVESRLSRVVTQNGFDGFEEYINHLFKDSSGMEVSLLVSKLTTNFTHFLREKGHYTFMEKRVFPQLSDIAAKTGLSIWSAGCSSGEEPYSIAMVTSNYFSHQPQGGTVHIHATDISQNVLNQAKAGVYTLSELSTLPPDWINRYFIRQAEDKFRISDELQRMVSFRYFNLNGMAGWTRGKYHVIFCRNVMIYFNQATKQTLINRFYDSLLPGGFLFIGMSETLIGLNTQLSYIQPAIYQRLK